MNSTTIEEDLNFSGKTKGGKDGSDHIDSDKKNIIVNLFDSEKKGHDRNLCID